MRKLTFLPLALLAAACSEDRCDPVLEAADCVRGETPMTARRGRGRGPQDSSAPTVSLPVGPTAGSAQGGGPTAGSAQGGGPTAGPAEGPGPTAGPAGGAGFSAGSTNAPDAYLGASEESPCAAFCETVYGLCADQIESYEGGDAGALRTACLDVCDCYVSAASSCIDEFLDYVGPCVEQNSCLLFAGCFDVSSPSGDAPFSSRCSAKVSAAQSDCLAGTGI